MDAPEAAKAAAENGPFVLKNLLPTFWMMGVAMLGGAVHFYQKVKAGKARPFNLMELFGELLTSGFVGIVTFWICRKFNLDEYLTATFVAITGHMGTRAIFLAEQWMEKKAKNYIP